MREAYEQLMGIPKSQGRDLPLWPTEGTTWPVNGSTGKPLTCFNWDQPFDHNNNFQSIQSVCSWIIKKGPEFKPGCGYLIKAISESDLLDRVVTKYKDFQKVWRIEQKRLTEVVASAVVDDGLDGGNVSNQSTLSKNTWQQRAKGVSVVQLLNFND